MTRKLRSLREINLNARVLVFNVSKHHQWPECRYVLGQTTSRTHARRHPEWHGDAIGAAYDATNSGFLLTDISYNRVAVFNVTSITMARMRPYGLGEQDPSDQPSIRIVSQ